MKKLFFCVFCVFCVDVHLARAQDAIDLRQAAIHAAPSDIASWPADYAITRVTMRDPGGIEFQSDALRAWPDYTPPGWGGPLQYTVWACVTVEGGVHCSAFVQMWRGRSQQDGSIPPILTNWNTNYAYDGRWAPMNDYVPHAGDTIYFFLSAGNARGASSVTSLRSRTNVVAVRLPINDVGVFDYSSVPSVPPVLPILPVPPIPPVPPVLPIPPVPPILPIPPVPPILPSVDLSPVLAQLATLNSKIDTLAQSESAFHSQVADAWQRTGGVVLKYVLPAIGAVLAGRATK